MAWLDELRRVKLPDGRVLIAASFRGVPFFVDDADRSGGRRLKVDEYPKRDQNTVQDLGRRARTYSVTGYLLGDDYLSQRDRLIDALEAAGPGDLVHPYYKATIRAHCESYSAPATRGEGRIGRVSVTFKEAPERAAAPAVQPQLEILTGSLALLTVQVVSDSLAETYDASGLPAFALESASTDIESIASAYRALVGPVITAAGPLLRTPDVAVQELANLEILIAAIVSDATVLVQDPQEAMARLGEAVESFQETAQAAAREVFGAMLAVYDTVSPPAAIGTTPTRVRERANQAALASALRIQALMVATALITDIDHATIEDAQADRDAVVERIDEQLPTANDSVYRALVDARAAVLRAVPGNQTLARVTTSQQNTAIPGLVLAYQLYGDPLREAEIIDRNPNQRHPGFLVGAIEVLSV